MSLNLLTDRQRECVLLRCAGRSVRVIAAQMGIDESLNRNPHKQALK